MSAPDPRLFARRLVVLDTETTGLDALGEDRIVEIGCIELIDTLPSGAEFHAYLSPGRAMPAAALAVHGLSDDFLADKPGFAQVAPALLDFLGDSPVVAHNAAFDIGFLDAALDRLGLAPLTMGRALCTLQLARTRLPGAKHSLESLCQRFAIDRSARVKHGALIDARLLASVYLELLGGRQIGMALAAPDAPLAAPAPASSPWPPAAASVSPPPPAHAASAEELERHRAFVTRLADPIWDRL